MGTYIHLKTKGTKNYIAVTEKPFGKVLALEKKLSLHRFTFVKQYRMSEIFYDTPNDLLSKAGIVVSKTITPEKSFFKVERQSVSLKRLSRLKETIFVHEIGARDTVKDHAFFLVDGIKSLFTTQFTIDLENVIKNLRPIITIDSGMEEWSVISGGGFKCKIFYKSSKISNLETKRKNQFKSMKLELDCAETYLSSFDYLVEQIDKYCKDFVEDNESLFDYCLRLTKPLPEKKKLTREEKLALKQKSKNAESSIQG